MNHFLTLVTIIITLSAHSQRHELNLNYRFGVPTNNFTILTPDGLTNHNYLKTRSVHDQGLTLNYKYEIWQKANLFLSTGIEFSGSKHYQPIYAIGDSKNHLDNIIIRKNRLTVHLFGIHKQFNLIDDRLLIDIGWDVINRFYFPKSDRYYSDFKSNNEDWIKYKYEFITYYDKYYENDGTVDNRRYMYLNADVNLHFIGKISNIIYVDFGFNYSRNNVFFYDYTYTVQYYYGGSPTPTSTWSFLGIDGLFDPKYAIRDHYIYLSLGLSYKFGKTCNEEKLTTK